ncbi:hypothetical protein BMJ21_22300 [Sinorhizobium medicae]|nr:hypothetical protein BMJ21_22300 [Sinorhizobium medicae]
MMSVMMVPFFLFPRGGLMPEGAGAPLLLPELARSSGGEGGQGDKSEGDHPPEGGDANPP